MKNNITPLISRSLAVILLSLLLIQAAPTHADATNIIYDFIDPLMVISFGDSYSSGEGIEPFYGQYDSLSSKVRNEDWLAHRSELSWPGQVEIPYLSGTMSSYRSGSSNCIWYFVASSGATTDNFYRTQEKKYKKGFAFGAEWGSYDLPSQLSVFDNGIGSAVDYVTLTIGGNDVDFTDIITNCVTHSSYVERAFRSHTLQDKMNTLWAQFSTTRGLIEQVYESIAATAPQAAIVVAGYPQLLNPNGGGGVINAEEANIVNHNVTRFNNELRSLVTQCKNNGMNIYFADVESEFLVGGHHGAYSSNAWINPVWLGHKDQDLSDYSIASAYSVHPNSTGAQHYAACVNRIIDNIEKARRGTLSGRICKASDRTTPVTDSTIVITSEADNSKTYYPDSNGSYAINLPEGEYKVLVSAPGYIDFTAYATVARGETTYLETFLLVEGSEDQTGIASGQVTNALTGSGVNDVMIFVRKGWNNFDQDEVIDAIVTDENGNYSLELPLGNYTLITQREDFAYTMFNIIVQEGTTPNQNFSISPIGSGDEYRIVLTWGENPSDLDSHVVGTLTSGGSFHVFYAHMQDYDGEIEVCNLDIDDTTSYGPETITLRTTSGSPYYYYIHRYAGEGSIATSGAQIRVYQGGTLIQTFNVPTNLGTYDYWNVFAIADGRLIIRNTMTSSPDVSYAGGSGMLMRAASISSAGSFDDLDLENLPEKEPAEETETDETELDDDDLSDELDEEDSDLPSDPTEDGDNSTDTDAGNTEGDSSANAEAENAGNGDGNTDAEAGSTGVGSENADAEVDNTEKDGNTNAEAGNTEGDGNTNVEAENTENSSDNTADESVGADVDVASENESANTDPSPEN